MLKLKKGYINSENLLKSLIKKKNASNARGRVFSAQSEAKTQVFIYFCHFSEYILAFMENLHKFYY